MPEILIENENYILYRDDVFIGCRLKTKDVNKDIAVDLIRERKKITGSTKDNLAIVEVQTVESVTKEARELFSGKDAADGFLAAAIIADNAITKVVAHFYLNFNKPPLPIKIFIDKEEAKKWLKKQSENQ